MSWRWEWLRTTSGAPEAALGAQYLRETGKKLGVPFLSANLRDGDGVLIAPSSIMVVAPSGGKRIMLVGVVSPRLVRGGLKVDEPRDAILAALKGAQEYDALVVLAYLREPELRQLAAELPEADARGGRTDWPEHRADAAGPDLARIRDEQGQVPDPARYRPDAARPGSGRWSS